MAPTGLLRLEVSQPGHAGVVAPRVALHLSATDGWRCVEDVGLLLR